MVSRIALFAACLSTVFVVCCAQNGTVPTPMLATEVTGVTTMIVTTSAPNSTNATTAQTKATTAPAPAPASTKPPITNTKVPSTKPPTKPPTKRPTNKPDVGTTAKPAGSMGGFSAGSFIGGIILAVAVMGIGLCAFKFYQSRQDKNYQTL